MADWHLDKKISIFMMAGLLMNIGVSTYGVVWNQAKQDSRIANLEQRPDLTERVIILETLQGEQSKLNGKFENTLDKILNKIDEFGREQSRRTPTIDRAEEHFRKGK